MIINICFGTRDLEKAGKFYDAVTAELGCARSNTTERSLSARSASNPNTTCAMTRRWV